MDLQHNLNFPAWPMPLEELSQRITDRHTLIEKVRNLETQNSRLQDSMNLLNESFRKVNEIYADERKKVINLQEKLIEYERRCEALESANEKLINDNQSLVLQNEQLESVQFAVEKIEKEKLSYKRRYNDLYRKHNKKLQNSKRNIEPAQEESDSKENTTDILQLITDKSSDVTSSDIEDVSIKPINMSSPVRKPELIVSYAFQPVAKVDVETNCNLFEEEKRSDRFTSQATQCDPSPKKLTKHTATNCNLYEEQKPSKRFVSRGTQHKYSTTTRSTCTSAFIKKQNVGTNFPEILPISVAQILKETIFEVEDVIEPIPDLPEFMVCRSIGTVTKLRDVRRNLGFIELNNSDSDIECQVKNIKVEREMMMGSLANLTELTNLRDSSGESRSLEGSLKSMWSILGNIIFTLICQTKKPVVNTDPNFVSEFNKIIELLGWIQSGKFYSENISQAKPDKDYKSESESQKDGYHSSINSTNRDITGENISSRNFEQFSCVSALDEDLGVPPVNDVSIQTIDSPAYVEIESVNHNLCDTVSTVDQSVQCDAIMIENLQEEDSAVETVTNCTNKKLSILEPSELEERNKKEELLVGRAEKLVDDAESRLLVLTTEVGSQNAGSDNELDIITSNMPLDNEKCALKQSEFIEETRVLDLDCDPLEPENNGGITDSAVKENDTKNTLALTKPLTEVTQPTENSLPGTSNNENNVDVDGRNDISEVAVNENVQNHLDLPDLSLDMRYDDDIVEDDTTNSIESNTNEKGSSLSSDNELLEENSQSHSTESLDGNSSLKEETKTISKITNPTKTDSQSESVKEMEKNIELCPTNCETFLNRTEVDMKNISPDDLLTEESCTQTKRKRTCDGVRNPEKKRRLSLKNEIEFENSKHSNETLSAKDMLTLMQEQTDLPRMIEPIFDPVHNKMHDSCTQVQCVSAATEETEVDVYSESPLSPSNTTDMFSDTDPLIIPVDRIQVKYTRKQKMFNSYMGSLLNNYSGKCVRHIQTRRFSQTKSETNLLEKLNELLQNYLSSESIDLVTTMVGSITELTASEKLISLVIIRVIKNVDEAAEKDFTCSISELNESFRRMFLLIEELRKWSPSIGNNLLFYIEKNIFVLNSRTIEYKAIVNITLLYLRLLKIENCKMCPVRVFICKCLYYYGSWGLAMTYFALLVYPKALPHGSEESQESTVMAIQCILNSTPFNFSESKQRELCTTLKYRYGYQRTVPTREQTVEFLANKIREGKFQNVSYAFSLVCKKNPHSWNIDHVMETILLPMIKEFSETPNTDISNHRLPPLLESISLILKALPANHDVTKYQQLFFKILNESTGMETQEAAIAALLRLSKFGVVDCFNRISKWKPKRKCTKVLRLMMQTFIYRKKYSYWKKLLESS